MLNRIIRCEFKFKKLLGRYSPLRRLLTYALTISIGFSNSGIAAEDTFVNLPRDLEIELALSALPEDLRAGAAIYLRDPNKGFILYRKGTNDWMTFVARTSVRFYDASWEYKYPSDQIIPMAYDKEGLTHHVIPYFDIERMRINGMAPKKAKNTISQRFADGTYTAPTKGGMSYMFAPIHRAYMEPVKSNRMKTVSFPHHMPYAPHMSASKIGTIDPHGRSGILDHGNEDSGMHGYLYFMVQPDQAEIIRTNYAELLLKLCKHHNNWCLPKNRNTSTED
jgi:hypothetical protein